MHSSISWWERVSSIYLGFVYRWRGNLAINQGCHLVCFLHQSQSSANYKFIERAIKWMRGLRTMIFPRRKSLMKILRWKLNKKHVGWYSKNIFQELYWELLNESDFNNNQRRTKLQLHNFHLNIFYINILYCKKWSEKKEISVETIRMIMFVKHK